MSSRSRSHSGSSSSSGHAPRTTASHGHQTDTIPTVSATGMPRIVPRHHDERDSSDQEEKDEEEGSAPSELDFASDDEPHYQPSGSLTLAALSPSSSLPMQRRLALLASSLFINLGLPFLNGVMLGFGEIFARVILAPVLGITNVGWSGDTSRASVRNPLARDGRVATQTSAWEWGQAREKQEKRSWHTWGAGSSGAVDPADLSPDVAYDVQE